jgi:hypothetical protein
LHAKCLCTAHASLAAAFAFLFVDRTVGNDTPELAYLICKQDVFGGELWLGLMLSGLQTTLQRVMQIAFDAPASLHVQQKCARGNATLTVAL